MRLIAFILTILQFTAWRAAFGQNVVLRIATVGPDGTAWARELKAVARELAAQTDGRVQVKWYMGGIAGNEVEMDRRVRRGQLDGVVSGGILCGMLSPAMSLTRLQAVFRNRNEVSYVLGNLRQRINDEFRSAGYENLGESILGATVIFSRSPITSFEDLTAQGLWRWDLDAISSDVNAAMGLKIVRLPIQAAGKAYEEHQIDGFFAIPAAALAFQWSAQARYLLDFRFDYIVGCLAVSLGAMDQLSLADQRTFKGLAAKYTVRFEDVGARLEEDLLGGLFQRQGITSLKTSPALRLRITRLAEQWSIPSRLSREDVLKVNRLLADYRAAQ